MSRRSRGNDAQRRPIPVVVGVDAEATTGDAVAWAAAEAAARHCPLRLVHALRWTLSAGPFGLALPSENLSLAQEAAERLLATTLARTREVVSDLCVSTRLLPWPLARTLLEESRHAQLLVLGGRFDGTGERRTRSAAGRIAAAAACPVAVVRAFGDVRSARSAPRVVVGVDGSTSATDALRFAFHAAAQRGVPLVAVHVRAPRGPADLAAARGVRAATEAAARRTLQSALARWRDEFAEVPLIAWAGCGDPAQALVEESRGAALTVIGSRSRGRLHTTLGPVARAVLQRARGPIAIVRHDRRPAVPRRSSAPARSVSEVDSRMPGTR